MPWMRFSFKQHGTTEHRPQPARVRPAHQAQDAVEHRQTEVIGRLLDAYRSDSTLRWIYVVLRSIKKSASLGLPRAQVCRLGSIQARPSSPAWTFIAGEGCAHGRCLASLV